MLPYNCLNLSTVANSVTLPSRHLVCRVQTRQFALLPAMIFLTLLSWSPKVNAQSGTLELTLEDSNQFKTLDNGAAKFKDAVKLSRKKEWGSRWGTGWWGMNLCSFSSPSLLSCCLEAKLGIWGASPRFLGLEEAVSRIPQSGQIWEPGEAVSVFRTKLPKCPKC
jgi:hypothetical protein